MPVSPTIKHGVLPDLDLVDETNLLVQSVELAPNREKREIKGGNAGVKALRFVNPTFRIGFSAIPSAISGLADQHPGTKITGGLANYQSARHGFDPSEGLIIYEDPATSLGVDSEPTVNFSGMQYPLLVTS